MGIKRALSRHKNELRRKSNVKEIGVFGSYVRESKKSSDFRCLVEFEEPVGIFEFMTLEDLPD